MRTSSSFSDPTYVYHPPHRHHSHSHSHHHYHHPKSTLDLEFTSELIPNILYFGGMPNERQLEQLSQHQFRMIVNVMTTEEKDNYPYAKPLSSYGMDLYEFCIDDQSVPQNKESFSSFLHHLIGQWLSLDQFSKTSRPFWTLHGTHSIPRMYVHCRGGHGRSALVAGILFFWFQSFVFQKKICGGKRIEYVTRAHHLRKSINPKYWSQPCPVARCQRVFLESWPFFSFPFLQKKKMSAYLK